MNGTPRMRSAFPQTPPSNLRRRQNGVTSPGSDRVGSPKLPDVRTLQSSKSTQDPPWIPFETVDAPSQRAYAFGIYICLFVYRLYDWYVLNVDETESLYLFLKWIAIDGAFLFGLPSFHIPWLEWSSATIMILFFIHTVFDAVLMFRIALPFSAALAPFARMLFSDKEYAISEHRVKAADILNDPKLILGRQIINILPEGSALLNPSKLPLCLGNGSPSVLLPLQINQTVPVSIELIRHDLDTSATEIVLIGSREAAKLRKEALKHNGRDASQPLVLNYAVKKPGLYRLGKVTDETKLEVSHPPSEAFVVPCPSAVIGHAGKTRCRGELSNIAMQVHGTPPLRIKYRKSVNDQDRDVSYQSIQPDDFVSPLVRQKAPGQLVLASDDDFSWASARKITVPLNETLSQPGDWTYSIDEVADAFGNVVSYSAASEEYERPKQKAETLEDSFYVFDRPQAALSDRKGPLKVAKGQDAELPIQFFAGSKKDPKDQKYDISYLFTPSDDITPNGDHSPTAQRVHVTVTALGSHPRVKAPGLYSLSTVASNSCQGEVIEPTSFQIINPPEPSVEMTSEKIFDKCAGRPIGLRVDFAFSGTPPFLVKYETTKDGRKGVKLDQKRFDGLRGQIELKPEDAGLWQYQLVELSDQVYRNQNLRNRGLKLDQSVKPSVSARLVDVSPKQGACIDEPVEFGVQMFGEGPWTLEYELVHGNKRKKSRVENIEDSTFRIRTDPLADGGEYSLILVGVSDQQKCRETLQQDAKVSVRQQRPKGAFGPIEGKRKVKTLQSKYVDLPVRLSGEGPWTVQYGFTSPDGSVSDTNKIVLKSANAALPVDKPGKYELLSVNDGKCPGSVDKTNSANTFEVDWIARPSIHIPEGPLLEKKGENRIVRNEVCEGDDDAVDLSFAGQPPYEVHYQEKIDGSRTVREHKLNVPMSNAQVKLDTAQAGHYEYTFTKLEDSNYDHDVRQHRNLVIEQRVNARPTASFVTPGKVYSFCTGDDAESLYSSSASDAAETIPITLTGKPPFVVDLEIKHHGRASKPTPLSIPNIASTKHDLSIPHRLLQTGNSFVSIRRVRDARGCERLLDPISSPRVQISVHDSPSITSTEPERTHYCVGERLAFSLSGMAPFSVFYDFNGKRMRASSPQPLFRRLAELPGNFTITGVQDAGSSCTQRAGLTKIVHALPRVEVSHGREARVDIHAGGEAEIAFAFWGEPPFEFTYTRSENAGSRRGGGGVPVVLETHTLESQERSMKMSATEAGTYEVVAIRDRYCSFARPGSEGELGKFRSQGLLT
ncbi:hypothetical protein FH972_025537 [Carpinus fangiana]|uniref:Ig-like domain-containing protein n=1 Tax=Carpinus fangiana TaxID=176857 RepID=A0A5N6L1B3_9ROSI|nr:hypothetical protein FH972_025537 [Carpinus fangiana]